MSLSGRPWLRLLRGLFAATAAAKTQVQLVEQLAVARQEQQRGSGRHDQGLGANVRMPGQPQRAITAGRLPP